MLVKNRHVHEIVHEHEDEYGIGALVEFEDLMAAQKCYDSDAYKAALEFSKQSSNRLVVLVDGI